MPCCRDANAPFVDRASRTLLGFLLFFASEAHAEVRRVVTLAPSLAEIAADVLGPAALDRIVGVSEYTDQPAALGGRPSVGSFAQPSREKILSLKPDLVLATRDGTPLALVESLRRDGVRVEIVSGDSLDEVRDSYATVGSALGMPEAGRKARERFAAGLESIRAESRGCAGKRVMLQFEAGPRDPIVVVGVRNFVNDAVELVGATNVYAGKGASERYPRPSAEDVVRRNPDLILVLALKPASAESALSQARSWWKRFSALTLNRTPDGVRVLASDEVQRPGPRLLEGIRKLKRAIHGENCR